MKIYTRNGDEGQTGLFGGGRVPKDDLRVSAYGELDELNATIGVARTLIAGAGDETLASVEGLLDQVQFELFDIGGELAISPDASDTMKGRVPVVDEAAIARLEGAIDAADEELPPQTYFVLPGGHPVAAQLHVSRTVCRRAERVLVAADRQRAVRPVILGYVNRLSDLLFTLTRLVNHRTGRGDVIWDPASRRASE